MTLNMSDVASPAFGAQRLRKQEITEVIEDRGNNFHSFSIAGTYI